MMLIAASLACSVVPLIEILAASLIAFSPYDWAISRISLVALLGTPGFRPPLRSPGLAPRGIFPTGYYFSAAFKHGNPRHDLPTLHLDAIA
jgi:hypothetical protein